MALNASYLGGVKGVSDPYHGEVRLHEVTLDLSRAFGKVPKDTLYGKQTGGKYAPFCNESKITAVSANTYTVEDVTKLAANDVVTYYDVSASGLSTETATVTDINTTTKVVSVNTAFPTPPAVNDRLVLKDGTELSANVVIMAEEVDFSSAKTDPVKAGIYEASRVDASQVGRTTYLDKTKLVGRRLFLDTI